MKPVLIQHLIRNRKQNRKPDPVSQQELEQQHNGSAGAIILIVAIIVVTGLLIA